MAFLHEKGCYLQGRRDVFSGANAHCISHLSVFTVQSLYKLQTRNLALPGKPTSI